MLHCFILGTAAKILTKPRKHQNPRKAESLWTLPKALKTSLRHTPGTFSCSYCETLKIGYPDPRSTLGSISSWEATIRHKPWNLLNKVTKNNIKGVSIAFLRISTDAPGHCPCQVPPCWKPQLLHFLAVEESKHIPSAGTVTSASQSSANTWCWTSFTGGFHGGGNLQRKNLVPTHGRKVGLDDL